MVLLAILLVKVRHEPPAFRLTLGALVALLISRAIFWMCTYPANRATENWIRLPDNWMQLRMHWEYSHAAGAVLDVIAFALLVLSVLPDKRAETTT